MKSIFVYEEDHKLLMKLKLEHGHKKIADVLKMKLRPEIITPP